jgi:anti-anti-sigma regulatory factor
VLAELRPVVAEIFQISRFDMVFELFPTVREALAAVSPDAAAAFDRG